MITLAHGLLLLSTLIILVQEGLSEVSLIDRIKLFEESKIKIEELRKTYPNLEFGVNQFSFMTEAEKKPYFGRQYLPKIDFPVPEPATYDPAVDGEVPASLDYRALNQVTSVKNQGNCGSCYAHAATGAVESQYLIRRNQSLDLSEQYVVECDMQDLHCEGAMPSHSERCVFDLYKDKGVVDEACEPYREKDGKCPNKPECKKYKIAGTKWFGEDESMFAAYLKKYGPVPFNSDLPMSFPYYTGGVFDETSAAECRPGFVMHATLLVGYTPTEWIVKNSYGTTWGEAGYFRVKRGINWCGFADNGIYAPYLDVEN